MHLSQRQWRASLSGVVLTVAWICYYFLTPKSPEERLAHAYSEFEKLQARIDELHGAALSYNFAIAFEKNTTTVNVEDEFAKLKTLLASAEKSSNDVQNEAHSKRVPEILLTTYQKLVKKGRYLWSILDNPDCGPKSRWINYAELDSWGWVRTEYPPVAGADKLGRFVDALNGRGLSTREEDYLDISWDHKKTTRHYRTDLEPTYGEYGNLFNPTQGVIIAYSNYSPAYKVSQRPKGQGDKAPLPELKQWSDIIFLTWKDLVADSPAQAKGLRYVLRHNVLNGDTKEIVSKAMKKVGVKSGIPPRWPGYTFRPKFGPNGKEDKAMEPFLAMLGTPNCMGVVWLLAQHQEVLGKEKVKAITVWDRSESSGQGVDVAPSILLELEDVVEEEDDE
ncbi:hypothetical protein LTR37_016829 [Vermiconidia calcicola]|uniref:Uncharacterized protein n=1 Tax=Vermiconidia calcicola TaxID=1690605 RepID=A0ACC3MLR9_9PEZI|nr:hypothetical protein LTR37_016829 [Vermiconidia calcicola]